MSLQNGHLENADLAHHEVKVKKKKNKVIVVPTVSSSLKDNSHVESSASLSSAPSLAQVESDVTSVPSRSVTTSTETPPPKEDPSLMPSVAPAVPVQLPEYPAQVSSWLACFNNRQWVQ